MKKIILVITFCLMFSVSANAADFYEDLNSIIVYDDVDACYIQNPNFTDGDVTFTTGDATPCLTSIETLNVDNVEGQYIYTYDKISLNNIGATSIETKEAVSTNGNETIETLDWIYINTGTFMESIDPFMVYEDYPDFNETWYILPDENVEFTSSETPTSYIENIMTLDGVPQYSLEVYSYDEDFTTVCDVEDSFVTKPIQSYSEAFYYESGNIASSYEANYALNTDCNVSDEMKMTNDAYYEFYENGQISYELIQSYENGVVTETIENSYDEEGNLIVEEPIETPVDVATPIVTPISAEVIEEPVTTTGVEQVPEKKLVKTGDEGYRVVAIIALVGALVVIRKYVL